MVRTEAETISLEDKTRVTTKRGRIKEAREESNEDEMDVGQPTEKEEKNFVGMMTRSRSRRGKRVLLDPIGSVQTVLNLAIVVPARQIVQTDQLNLKQNRPKVRLRRIYSDIRSLYRKERN